MYTAEKNPNKIYGYFKKAISFNCGVSISLKKDKKIKKQLSLDDLKNSTVIDYFPYYEIFEKLDLNVQKQICDMVIKESILQIKNNPSITGNFKKMFIENTYKQFEINKKKLINDFLEKNKDKFKDLLDLKLEFENEEKKELNIQEKKGREYFKF